MCSFILVEGTFNIFVLVLTSTRAGLNRRICPSLLILSPTPAVAQLCSDTDHL